MVLGPPILGVFEQLGLLEELHKFSLDCRELVLLDENLKNISTVGWKNEKAL